MTGRRGGRQGIMLVQLPAVREEHVGRGTQRHSAVADFTVRSFVYNQLKISAASLFGRDAVPRVPAGRIPRISRECQE